jgi:hypothetical protein
VPLAQKMLPRRRSAIGRSRKTMGAYHE